MPCKRTQIGDITMWECSRGQREDEPCSVKEGDVRCEQPARRQCGHPITPRQRGGKLQTTCNRLLCDEHSHAALGTWVCPFHQRSQ